MADAAHNHFWQTSDSQLVVLLLCGWGLDALWPLTLGAVAPILAVRIVGGVLLIAGFALWQWTRILMKRREQPDGPWKPTTQLIDAGPFAYSRNPIYVGIATVMLGLALAFDMPWWLALWPVYVGVLFFIQILPEEQYLREKFSDKWLDYCRDVRRWL